MTKVRAAVLAVMLAVSGLIACGHPSRACAADNVYAVGSYGGRSSGGGGYSGGGGRSSGYSGGSRSTPKAPSNSGARSGSSSKAGSSSSKTKAPSNSGAKSSKAPTNSGARPVTNPKAVGVPAGGVPSRITGSHYTYHGTNGVTHVYVYHSPGYWTAHYAIPDPFNPFDPRNFYNPLSPYYQMRISC